MEAWRQELYSSELYHHGILGQKWGVRRYQNDDGSLTAAGKSHYGLKEKINAYRENRSRKKAERAKQDQAAEDKRTFEEETKNLESYKRYKKYDEKSKKYGDEYNEFYEDNGGRHNDTLYSKYYSNREKADKAYEQYEREAQSYVEKAMKEKYGDYDYEAAIRSSDRRYLAKGVAIVAGLGALTLAADAATNAIIKKLS